MFYFTKTHTKLSGIVFSPKTQLPKLFFEFSKKLPISSWVNHRPTPLLKPLLLLLLLKPLLLLLLMLLFIRAPRWL